MLSQNVSKLPPIQRPHWRSTANRPMLAEKSTREKVVFAAVAGCDRCKPVSHQTASAAPSVSSRLWANAGKQNPSAARSGDATARQASILEHLDGPLASLV